MPWCVPFRAILNQNIKKKPVDVGLGVRAIAPYMVNVLDELSVAVLAVVVPAVTWISSTINNPFVPLASAWFTLVVVLAGAVHVWLNPLFARYTLITSEFATVVAKVLVEKLWLCVF